MNEDPEPLPTWEVHPALPRLVDWLDHLAVLRGPDQQPPGMNDWATYPIGSCGTCDGGGCPDCTDPVG